MSSRSGRTKGEKRVSSLFIQITVIVLFLTAMVVNTVIIVQGVMSPIQVVASNSMAPYIDTRDGLILGSAAPESLQVGQVVVFPDPEVRSQRIVHRIVGIEQMDGAAYLVTKGDNNPVADPFLTPADNVEGRVAVLLPNFGIFFDFVNSPYGFALTVISPFMLLLLNCIFRARQDKLRLEGRYSLLFTSELIGAR
jgi:signal peptidase